MRGDDICDPALAGAGAETAGWLAAGAEARGEEPLPPA